MLAMEQESGCDRADLTILPYRAEITRFQGGVLPTMPVHHQ
ncbi:hypothetical protein [Coleofasciculus sp. E1-EBD-02]